MRVSLTRALRAALALQFGLLSVHGASAWLTDQGVMLFGGVQHLSGSAIDLNFATGQFYTRGATGPLTNTRATPATCLDAAGNLYQVAAGVTCIAPGLGAGVWEARTNSIRNNTMAGAIPGTPGVVPTGWQGISAIAGVTITLAFGVEYGMAYSDVIFTGTPSVSGPTREINPQLNTDVSALYGQTWTQSWRARIAGGTSANITFQLENRGFQNDGVTSSETSVGGNLALAQTVGAFSWSSTFQTSATAYGRSAIQATYTSGLPINITLRVYAPQFELNPLIAASVASAVTAASGTGGVNGAGVYSVSGGTCATPPQLNVTWAGGVLTVNSVAGAGSCSVLPPSPATLAYVSGAATGWTGATVTLTPTNNAAQGFATPPILTSGTAVTRAADSLTMATQPCANPSIYATGMPYAPTNYPVDQVPIEIDDGTVNNQLQIRRPASGAALLDVVGVGGSFTTVSPSGTWAQNTSGKSASQFTGSAILGTFNNGAIASSAKVGAISPTTLRVGSTVAAAKLWNGYISRVALACGASLLTADASPRRDHRLRLAALAALAAAAPGNPARARRFADAA